MKLEVGLRSKPQHIDLYVLVHNYVALLGRIIPWQNSEKDSYIHRFQKRYLHIYFPHTLYTDIRKTR